MEAYLYDVFGQKVRLKAMPEKERKLPFFLDSSFVLYTTELSGHQLIIAEIKSEDGILPDRLAKRSEQLTAYLHKPVLFVFDELEGWQRKRLIEKQIGFAQPFKQLYIPSLLLHLKEQTSKKQTGNTIFKISPSTLTPPAQCLLLYHLQVESLSKHTFGDLAQALNYSPMTITRIAKELVERQLVEVKGSKEKKLKFLYAGRQLWDKALPYLQSPVREYWYTDKLESDNDKFLISGDTAFSEYTMLSPTKEVYFAIGKEEFRLRKEKNWFKSLHNHPGPYRIEVWHYSPSILSDKRIADKLSVYLTMMSDTDVRVQAELEDLINNMKWLSD